MAYSKVFIEFFLLLFKQVEQPGRQFIGYAVKILNDIITIIHFLEIDRFHAY